MQSLLPLVSGSGAGDEGVDIEAGFVRGDAGALPLAGLPGRACAASILIELEPSAAAARTVATIEQ